MERIIRTRQECPQIGVEEFWLVEMVWPKGVLAHTCTDGDWAIVVLHNLSAEACEGMLHVQLWDGSYGSVYYLFEDRDPGGIEGRELQVDLTSHGFCWPRLRQR